MKLFIIEGNIGVGKSFTLNYLKNHFKDRCIVYDEPVDLWCKSGLLQYYYENTHNAAFAFQLYAISTMDDQFRQCVENTDHKVEVLFKVRSCNSCFNVFSTKLRDDMILNAREFSILKNIYENTFEYTFLNSKPKNDIDVKTVYINSSVEKCMSGIKKRGISVEVENISHGYLKSLQDNIEKNLKFDIILDYKDERPLCETLKPLLEF